MAHDDVAEHLAQVRHVGLQRATATRRRILAVDRLEQHVHRHRASSRGDQHRDDDPLLGTAERERNPVDEDLQRAQHPIVHADERTPRSRPATAETCIGLIVNDPRQEALKLLTGS